MIDILIITPEITKGMKSIGSKCLLPLRKNLTVIEHQITQIQKIIKHGNVTINIGFDYEKIMQKMRKHKNIQYLINTRYEDTNQGNNIILYINQHNPKKLLVLSSGLLIKDGAFDKKYLNDECSIFMLNKQKHNFTIGSAASNEIEYLFFDLDEPWSEIVYFNETAINILKSYDPKIFEQMYLFEIINFLISKNIKFNKFYINKSQIMKINNVKDLIKAKTFI